MPRASKKSNEIPISIEEGGEEPVSQETATRALVLLAQWALRQAKKRAECDNRSSGEVVTVDFSKDYVSRKAEN